jgi:hypothetical protein
MGELVTFRSTKTFIARLETMEGFYSHNLIMKGLRFQLDDNDTLLMVDLTLSLTSDRDTNTYQDAESFVSRIGAFYRLWLDLHYFEKKPGFLKWVESSNAAIIFKLRPNDQPVRLPVKLVENNSYIIFEHMRPDIA